MIEDGETMPRRMLKRIQESVCRGAYDVTAHAVEEMAEAGLDLADVELALVDGDLVNIKRDDLREEYAIL